MTVAHFILPDGTVNTVDAFNDLSLMEAARRSNVPGIIADCGGGAMCATCHVLVSEAWVDIVGPPNPNEDLMLELAPGRTDRSRLSCQICMNGSLDGIVVHIPEEQA